MSGTLGLTEHEIANLERMVAADRNVAHIVMVDMIVAALNGASKAGVELSTMVIVLDRTSQKILDRARATGFDPLAPIKQPRKAV